RREVPDVAVLDFASQYPSLYIRLGVEKFLTALEIHWRDGTEEIRRFVDATTLEDLLRPETWRDSRMWAVCDVEATGEILPLRSTYSGPLSDPPTIGWNHGITQESLTLPYLVADLLAAKLLG